MKDEGGGGVCVEDENEVSTTTFIGWDARFLVTIIQSLKIILYIQDNEKGKFHRGRRYNG